MFIVSQHFDLPDAPDDYWNEEEEEQEDDFEVPEEEPMSDYYAPDYMDER